jgi:hypothetical protein
VSASDATYTDGTVKMQAPADCNQDGVYDVAEITSGIALDCNSNAIPDSCEADCNQNGIADDCEPDCNGNGIPDECDITSGLSMDCDLNGIPDSCDLLQPYADIDGDGVLDVCLTPSLHCDVYEVSVQNGGTQNLYLTAPMSLDAYLLTGSMSGTSPGTPAGAYVLPLNVDSYMMLLLQSPYGPPLSPSWGVLLPSSGSGVASATFVVPPFSSPSYVGLQLHHAYVVVSLFDGSVVFVSNAVPLLLVP